MDCFRQSGTPPSDFLLQGNISLVTGLPDAREPCVLTQLAMRGGKLPCGKKWRSTHTSSQAWPITCMTLFASPTLSVSTFSLSSYNKLHPVPSPPLLSLALHPQAVFQTKWLTTPWAIFTLSPPLRQLQPLMKPTPHQACQRIQSACGGGEEGHIQGICDLTLPILLIFSSCCNLAMVASSWPLPHLATVHHWRCDSSYTPIKKTDIRPPVSKESTGENTSLLINKLTYTVSAYIQTYVCVYTWHITY